jgi:hypothetical protein
VVLFFASAGASSAYLTVSEVFPMETRAMAIAFFYAIGTAAGGITGPLVFGHLIDSGSRGKLAAGFFAGAVVMAIGGIAELIFGVNAEQRSLESIAEPITQTDGGTSPASPGNERTRARRERSRAGMRRYQPGPGGGASAWSSRMSVSSGPPDNDRELDREVDLIERALSERGPLGREELAAAVHARFWGPGRFRPALREAIAEGKVRSDGRRRYALIADSRDERPARTPDPKGRTR